MTNYISPFKLFDLPINASEQAIALNKASVLNRAKHYKTLDEIYVGSSQVIKGTALRLLSELDNYYTRQYHIAIFEDKSLLNFLEYGHLNYFRNQTTNSLPLDAEFIKFIAPFFSYQYSETLLQAIKKQDRETLHLLSTKPLPMVGDFEEKCFQEANNYVAETIQQLKVLRSDEKLVSMSERELVSHLPNKRIELYNILPDYFSSARNLIGNEIYSLSVTLLQNYGRSDGASIMLQQGLKLKLDTAVRQNLEKMLKNFSFRSKIPSFIWVAIAAISFLYMLKYIETVFFTN